MNPLNLMKRLRNLLALFRLDTPRECAVNRLPHATGRSFRRVGMHHVLDDAEQVGRMAVQCDGDASQDCLGDGLGIHHFLSNV